MLGFPSFFYDPPPYRGPRTAPFDEPRSPSLALGPVLSPATPRDAAWGGRGTVARPRAVAWRWGKPSQNGAFENRQRCEDPKRATFICVVVYNKDTASVGLDRGSVEFYREFYYRAS